MLTIHSAMVLAIQLLLGAAGPQAAAGGAAFKLAGVDVAGAKRYTAAEVAKAGGLKVGQSVTLADVAAAAERLGSSGLFKSLSYRYLTKAGGLTVTFEFDEADWTVPVVFDNFVWFPDQELTAAVRQDVPSFDGTAPPTEGIVDLITRSLAGVMKTRQLPGQVHYTPEADLKGNLLRHVFNVKDPAPKVCGVQFDGAAAISAAQLLEPIRAVVNGDYSRVYLTAVSQGTLRNLYRQRGHWRAAFRGPASTVVESPGCSGVSVTFAVTEGMPYKFERAEWTGTAALPAATLDKSFGVKSGDIADLIKLDAGLRQIHQAYGTQGYVTQSARYTPRLDDATGGATFEVAVEEGPQFMMGELEITGLPDADVADLRKRWRLKAGEVYDASYADQFHSDVILPWQRRAGPSAKKLSIQTRADPDRRVVDVRLVSQ